MVRGTFKDLVLSNCTSSLKIIGGGFAVGVDSFFAALQRSPSKVGGIPRALKILKGQDTADDAVNDFLKW